MIIDKQLLDSLTEQAKQNPRLRQAYDLRNTPEDNSQRMLNALEPGTVLPIHRHRTTSEVTAVIRGSVRQNFYNVRSTGSDLRTCSPEHQRSARAEIVLIESFIASAKEFTEGQPNFYVIPAGQWHNTECLESGTIIFECKDGKYAPLEDSDILNVWQ